MNVKFPIGSIVRYNAPEPEGERHWSRGRVIANEHYEDDNGVRKWVYVRWYSDDGKPESSTITVHENELVLAGEMKAR